MIEIRALTGLRGIAAILVLWFHMRSALEARGLSLVFNGIIDRFIDGSKSVDLFFVLSGFIMTLVYEKWFSSTVTPKNYFTFLERRFARIYPLHFFLLLLVISLVVAATLAKASTLNGLDRFDFGTLVPYFLLVQAWGPFMDGIGEWNPPAWSISIEALAYLFFPIMVLLTSRWQQRYRYHILAAAVAAGFGLNAITTWDMYGFGGCARGLSEFFLGCVAAYFYKGKMATWLQTNAGSTISFALLLAAFAFTPQAGFIIAVATMPVLLALSQDNIVSRVFAWRPMYFLGEISYSIYLGHFIFTSMIWRVISVDWMRSGNVQTVVGIICANLIVIALSTATYYTVERPGRDYLTRRKKPAAGAVTP